MSVNQLRRMDVIDRWRQEAYLMSGTDRLGRVIMKSLDLMMTVVSDGLTSETLASEIQSLTSEREKTLLMDINACESSRSLLYGMSACLCVVLESIMERHREQVMEPISTSTIQQESERTYGQNGMGDYQFVDEFTEVKYEEDYNIKQETLLSPVITEPMNFLEELKAPLHEDGGFSESVDCVSAGTSVIVKAEPVSPGDLFVEKGRYVEPGKCRIKTARWDNQTQMFGPQFRPEIIKVEPAEPVDFISAKWVDYYSPNKTIVLPDSSFKSAFGNSSTPVTVSALSTCAECGKEFDSSKGLHFHAEKRKEHIASTVLPLQENPLPSANSTPEFECRYCGKKCWTEQSLLLHQSMHKELHCRLCEITFHTATGLARHRRIEHSRPLTCSRCLTTFTNTFSLKKHILSKTCKSRLQQSQAHTAGARQYPCDQCSKSFPTYVRLSCHRRTVHGDKTYQCETYGEKFSALEDFGQHFLEHLRGEAPLVSKCPLCPAVLANYHELENHRRANHSYYEGNTHSQPNGRGTTPEKGVIQKVPPASKSSVYPAVLPDNKELGNHRRTNESLEPTKAIDEGNAQPNEQGAAPKNIGKQRVEPFFCTRCPSSFTTYNCLVVHREEVHGYATANETAKCTICGALFADRKEIAKHMKWRHRNA